MHKVEEFLSELASNLQIMRIYTYSHPKTASALDGLYQKLRDVLCDYNEMIIGIVGEEFVFGSEIFFDLSKRLKDLILDLNNKGIEKITFSRGIEKDELMKFVKALITKKETIGSDFKEYFRSLGLMNIAIDKIKISEGKESQEKRAKTFNYNDALGVVASSFKGILHNEFIDFYYTKAAMKTMLGQLLMGRFDFLAFTSVKQFDLATFVHSLNVAVLSMYFSSKLGFKKEDVLEVGMAALFHDMGKIAISKKVIQKPAILTDEEMDQVRSHTFLGAQILIQYTDSLGFLPALVAFEHHLKYNLKGYPKVRFPRRPNVVSLIISLCDCYDALRSRRSYKRDYTPELIYNIMLKDRGQAFEPPLFDKFF